MGNNLKNRVDQPYKSTTIISQIRKLIGQFPLLGCPEDVTWLGPSTIPGCMLQQTDISENVVDFLKTMLGTSCYNCLGWSLSENKWLQVPGKSFPNQKAAEIEVEAFISLHLEVENRKLFNVPVVKKFDTPSDKLLDVKEGAVAFYFYQAKSSGKFHWIHAAKYTESIVQDGEEKPLQQWTSKLGMSSLVAHKHAETVNCIYSNTNLILYTNPLEYIDVENIPGETPGHFHSEL